MKKKKIVKKINLQSEVNRLTQELKQKDLTIGNKEAVIGQLEGAINTISEIVGYTTNKSKPYYSDESARVWPSYSLEELISEISSTSKELRRIEGLKEKHLDMIESENSRLWYLVRAITGDETLKGPETSNHEYGPECCGIDGLAKLKSPFKKPRF